MVSSPRTCKRSRRFENTSKAKSLGEKANRLVKQNEGIWAKYLETFLTPEEAVLTKTKGEQHVQYVSSMNRTMQLAANGEFEAAAQYLVKDTVPKFNALRDTVFALLNLQSDVAGKEYMQAQSTYDTTFMILAVAIGAGILLAMISGRYYCAQ